MYFNCSNITVTSLLVFFALVIPDSRAMEADKVSQASSHTHEARMGKLSHLPSQTNLILEHTLWVEGSDSQGYYSYSCYRLTFEKDGKLGAVHILGSDHLFPFAGLPIGYRSVIISSDYLIHELSSEDINKNIFHEWQQFLFPKSFTIEWFNRISNEHQGTLKEDSTVLTFLKNNFPLDSGKTDNVSALFDQFHPFIFCGIHIHRLLYEKVGSMDLIAQSHFKNWLGLEPRNIHLTSALSALEISPERIIQYLSFTKDEILAHYQRLYGIKEPSEEPTMDDKIRNTYWIENSIPRTLQPEKLGLMMFGKYHLVGSYGIITFLQNTLAYMNYRKYRYYPSKKIKWKGVHFLRLEHLKGRVWEEIRTDSW